MKRLDAAARVLRWLRRCPDVRFAGETIIGSPTSEGTADVICSATPCEWRTGVLRHPQGVALPFNPFSATESTAPEDVGHPARPLITGRRVGGRVPQGCGLTAPTGTRLPDMFVRPNDDNWHLSD